MRFKFVTSAEVVPPTPDRFSTSTPTEDDEVYEEDKSHRSWRAASIRDHQEREETTATKGQVSPIIAEGVPAPVEEADQQFGRGVAFSAGRRGATDLHSTSMPAHHQ